MTQWQKVFGTQAEKPAELDTASSPTTVYQRRNIKAAVHEDGQGQQVQGWEYEERQLGADEYERLLAEEESPATQAIMQAISDVQLTLAFMQAGV